MPFSESDKAQVPLIIADLYEAAGALRRRADAIAKALGQSQARWQVLSAASADPRTVPQIARRLGVGRQNVQRIADLLVGKDLARFADNPDHRTSPYLVLSEAGKRVLARLTRRAGAYHQEVADALPAAEFAALRRGLRALCAALERNSDEEGERP
jgi:DNA-binding MarR family transcriptional regulator